MSKKLSNITGLLKRIFTREEEPCDHQLNWVETKYLVDNTPFVSFYCNDCGYHDQGVVYGDPEGWEKTITCANGVQTEG